MSSRQRHHDVVALDFNPEVTEFIARYILPYADDPETLFGWSKNPFTRMFRAAQYRRVEWRVDTDTGPNQLGLHAGVRDWLARYYRIVVLFPVHCARAARTLTQRPCMASGPIGGRTCSTGCQ